MRLRQMVSNKSYTSEGKHKTDRNMPNSPDGLGFKASLEDNKEQKQSASKGISIKDRYREDPRFTASPAEKVHQVNLDDTQDLVKAKYNQSRGSNQDNFDSEAVKISSESKETMYHPNTTTNMENKNLERLK